MRAKRSYSSSKPTRSQRSVLFSRTFLHEWKRKSVKTSVQKKGLLIVIMNTFTQSLVWCRCNHFYTHFSCMQISQDTLAWCQCCKSWLIAKIQYSIFLGALFVLCVSVVNLKCRCNLNETQRSVKVRGFAIILFLFFWLTFKKGCVHCPSSSTNNH